MHIAQSKFTSLRLLVLSVFLISACSEDAAQAPEPKTQSVELIRATGVFLDSHVQGLGYEYEVRNDDGDVSSFGRGQTDQNGHFRYFPGNRVRFYLGDIELGDTIGKSIVTPLDLADTTDINDPKVVRILRLLQSLDSDGEPENGIKLEPLTIDAANTYPVAIQDENFETLVGDLLEHADNRTNTLVDESDALAHFQASLDALETVAIAKPSIRALSDQTMREDQSLEFSFLISNDTENHQSLATTVISDNESLFPPENISIESSGLTRIVTLVPAAHQFGLANITVTVSNKSDNNQNGFSSTSKTFAVQVDPEIDIPVITDTRVTLIQNDDSTSLFGSFLDSVENPDGGELTFSICQAPDRGTLTLNENGDFEYEPESDFYGDVTFCYQVDNGIEQSEETEVTLTIVNPNPNQAPVAYDSSESVNEDTPLLATFEASDPDSDTLIFVIETAPQSGELIVDSDNNGYRYEPDANFYGQDTFNFYASDGELQSTVQTVTIAVNAVNDRPSLSAFSAQSTLEDQSLVNLAFEIRDIESPAAALLLNVQSSNSALVPNQAANIVLSGNGDNRQLTLTPIANAVGETSITVTVADPENPALFASESFVLTVVPVNDPPVTTNRSLSVDEDTLLNASLSTSAADLEGDTLTFALQNNVTHGTLDLLIDGRFSYQPNTNYVGSDTFTYRVNDGELNSNVATVTLIVGSDNDIPVANTSEFGGEEDENIQGQLTGSDVENSPLTFSLIEQPSSGSIIAFNATSGEFTYEPNADYNGPDTFSFIVNDGELDSTPALVTLTVDAVNDAPVLSELVDQVVAEDTDAQVFTIAISDAETLPEALSLTLENSNAALVQASLGGTGPNRTLTLEPVTDQYGSANITLTVNDGELSNQTSFTLTVDPVNDAPVISEVSDRRFAEDTSETVTLTIQDVDHGDAALDLRVYSSNESLLSLGAGSIPLVNGTAQLVLSPEPNANGSTTVTVEVSDGDLQTRDTFTVQIDPVNDAPTAANTTFSGDEDQTISQSIANLANDTESDPLSFSLVTPPLNGALDLSPNGSFTYTPASNDNGNYYFVYRASDGDLESNNATVYLNIGGVDDPTVIANVSDREIDEDTSIVLDIEMSDPDTAIETITLDASSSNTALLPNSVANISIVGNGNTRQLTLTPAADAYGTTTITLSAPTAEDITFDLTVEPVNDAPQISTIDNVQINEDGAVSAITFQIDDVDNLATALEVTASSANQEVFTNASLVLGGNGENRTFNATPITDANGSSLITISVSDGTAVSTESFEITVNPVEDPTIISEIDDQQINEDESLSNLSFSISDVDTPLDLINVTATSSNQALLPNDSITPITGTDSVRTFTATPLPNAYGTTTITLSAPTGVSEIFVLEVLPVNDAPTISVIANRLIDEDNVVNTITFQVNDVDNLASSLEVAATSANEALFTNENIILGGSDENRTFYATPVENANGSALITLNVSDGSASTFSQFLITVTPVDDPTIISPIPDQIIDEDTTLPDIAFSLSDIDTPLDEITVTTASSNLTLISQDNISLSGSGGDRSLTATPNLNENGTTTITLSAPNADSVSFTVQVNPVTDPIYVNAGDNIIIHEDLDPVVTLPGVLSDPDNIVVNYFWNQQNGPSVTLSDNLALRPYFNTPSIDALVTFSFCLYLEIYNADIDDTEIFVGACVDLYYYPAPPNTPQIASFKRDLSGTLVLDWEELSDAQGYDVYIGSETGINKDNFDSIQNGQQIVVTSPPLEITGLENGLRYYAVVDAYNEGGESGVSAEISEIPFGRINDTGITSCHIESSEDVSWPYLESAACNTLTDLRDAKVGRDATHNDDTDGFAGFSFTKLDAEGNALPSDASEWSCVRDEVTGLMWEHKETEGSGLPRAADDSFAWSNIDFPAMGILSTGNCWNTDNCTTEGFTNQVNATSLCGASSWRLPWAYELMGIFNANPFEFYSPYFQNVETGYYWVKDIVSPYNVPRPIQVFLSDYSFIEARPYYSGGSRKIILVAE